MNCRWIIAIDVGILLYIYFLMWLVWLAWIEVFAPARSDMFSVCLFSLIKNIPSFKCWSIDQLNSIFNDIICSSAKSLDPVLRYWHSPSINFSRRGQLSHSLLRHGSDHLHIRSYQCHVIFHLQIVLNVCFKIEIKNCYRL